MSDPAPNHAATSPAGITQLDPPRVLANGGEMGALMRVHDWAATPLASRGARTCRPSAAPWRAL